MVLCGGRDHFELCGKEVDWNSKAPKAHHVVHGQSESAHHPDAQGKCDVVAHETDGTTTCLDHAPDKLNEDAGGETGEAAKGNRGAPSGVPGLSGFF
jgi:hypothetical protein